VVRTWIEGRVEDKRAHEDEVGRREQLWKVMQEGVKQGILPQMEQRPLVQSMVGQGRDLPLMEMWQRQATENMRDRAYDLTGKMRANEGVEAGTAFTRAQTEKLGRPDFHFETLTQEGPFGEKTQTPYAFKTTPDGKLSVVPLLSLVPGQEGQGGGGPVDLSRFGFDSKKPETLKNLYAGLGALKSPEERAKVLAGLDPETRQALFAYHKALTAGQPGQAGASAARSKDPRVIFDIDAPKSGTMMNPKFMSNEATDRRRKQLEGFDMGKDVVPLLKHWAGNNPTYEGDRKKRLAELGIRDQPAAPTAGPVPDLVPSHQPGASAAGAAPVAGGEYANNPELLQILAAQYLQNIEQDMGGGTRKIWRPGSGVPLYTNMRDGS